MNWTVDIVEVGILPDLPWSIYLPDASPDARLDVPCYSYLLTRPEACLLIDTGPDREQSARAGFAIVGHALPALQRALGRRGRAAGETEAIIHTHLHYDHMQNDGFFPHAEIVVQCRELQWARSEDADRFYVGIDAFANDYVARLHVVEGESDIRDGLTVIPSGGHTPGHQSVIVQTAEGPVCICGDVIPMQANIAIPAPSMDPTASESFMARAREAGWEMLPGHDPALRAHRWYVSPL
jgi:glyoxylase-like metal-dependent hydrolase (beta-lactamase superfamily II)